MTISSIVESNWLVLLKVVELGGITRAATALGVTQSHVSRQISELERSCGARLFERTGRGVALTAFGWYLLPKVKEVVNLSDQLVVDIISAGATVMGDVRIGLLPSLVPLLAPTLHLALRERFPRLRVNFTEGASAQLQELLSDGRLDVATLLRDDEANEAVDGLVLWELPLYLVGAAGNDLLQAETVALSAIDGVPLVLPGEPHVMRGRLARLCREYGLRLVVSVEASSIELQHQIAAAGGGLAITARPCGQAQPLAISRLVSPELVRCIVLSTSPRRNETSATRETFRVIAELAPAVLSIFGAARASGCRLPVSIPANPLQSLPATLG